VVCVGLKWELDALAADMLVHALQHEGLGARALPAVAVSADHIGELDLSGVRVVCVSCFSQSPEISARFVCRRLRRQRPDLRIVLALWAGPQALLVPGAVETLGADAAAASFDEALQRLKGYAGAEDRPVAEAAPAAPAPAPALPSTDDLDSCMSLEDAARHAGEVFDVDAAMVLLADRRCHSWSASPESAGFGPALLSAGLADRALAEPERFSVPDVARDPRWADDAAVPAAGVRFVACTALYDEAGTVLGALCLMDARARTLSPQDERLLAALGEEVAGMLRASAGKDSPQVFASYPLSGGARASSA
jgi:hypothetical protein